MKRKISVVIILFLMLYITAYGYKSQNTGAKNVVSTSNVTVSTENVIVPTKDITVFTANETDSLNHFVENFDFNKYKVVDYSTVVRNGDCYYIVTYQKK